MDINQKINTIKYINECEASEIQFYQDMNGKNNSCTKKEYEKFIKQIKFYQSLRTDFFINKDITE